MNIGDRVTLNKSPYRRRVAKGEVDRIPIFRVTSASPLSAYADLTDGFYRYPDIQVPELLPIIIDPIMATIDKLPVRPLLEKWRIEIPYRIFKDSQGRPKWSPHRIRMKPATDFPYVDNGSVPHLKELLAWIMSSSSLPQWCELLQTAGAKITSIHRIQITATLPLKRPADMPMVRIV